MREGEVVRLFCMLVLLSSCEDWSAKLTDASVSARGPLLGSPRGITSLFPLVPPTLDACEASWFNPGGLTCECRLLIGGFTNNTHSHSI